MGKQLLLGLAFAAIGGFTGGLFTAGAFSALGASVGIAAGSVLFAPKPESQTSALSFQNTSKYGFFISEFAGTVGNVGGNWICVGKDDKGDPAGLIRVKGDDGGKSDAPEPDTALLIGAMLIGRAMGGTLDSPEPLFIDKGEIEDGGEGGRRCFYDRYGDTEETKGYTLTPTVSTVTGRVICETSDELAFYTGTDEQMPDASLSAFWGEDLPAFRGCCYARFNRFPVNGPPTFYWTVRSATTGRHTIIRQKLENCGIPANGINLDAIPADAQIKGKSIGSPTSAREICEKTARRVFCDFAFDGKSIVATSRTNPTIHSVSWEEMGAWNSSGTGMTRDTGSAQGEEMGANTDGRLVIKTRGQEELCSIARVAYVDINQGYDGDEPASAPQSRAHHTNALDYDLAECEDLSGATNFALALRDEDWNGDTLAAFSVLSGHEHWLPGDVLNIALDRDGSLGTRAFLLQEAERQADGILNCQAQSYAGHVYTQNTVVDSPHRPSPVVEVEAPAIFGVSDCVPLSDEITENNKPGLLAWVSQSRQKKWSSGTVRIGTPGNPDKFARETVSERATCGVLTSAFNPQTDAALALKARLGELESASTNRDIRNVLLLEPGLVITFDTATLLDYDPDADELFYSLSNLISGRFGSDYLLDQTFPAGTQWVLLRDADGDETRGVRFYPVSRSFVGATVAATCLTGLKTKHIYTSSRDLNFAGNSVLALSPTIERARLDESGNLLLSGRSRTRYASDAIELNVNRHRRSEPRYSQGYRFQLRLGTRLVSLYTLDDRASFDWTVPAATLAGARAGALCQMNDFGAGRETAFTF